MDRLNNLLRNTKEYVKNISLKKAMCIYIFFAIIFIFTIWIITISICSAWKYLIYNRYNLTSSRTMPIDYLNVDENARNILKLIEFIKTYSIFIYSIIGTIVTSKLYYNNKIKEPLNILKTEASYVARGDLSFQCKYESGDEMAMICNIFNDMRLKLIENNKAMWNLIEEQSQLNAILSHELRNPLSILEGYNEMLVKYFPDGKIDEEKLISTLTLMNKQIIRMKEFLNKIKSIRSFSEMKIDKKKRNLNIVFENIKEIAEGAEKGDIDIKVHGYLKSIECFFDLRAIEEVVGNLISNAIRFANKEIIITIELEDCNIKIYVKDDGKGFSQKELYKALDPFYTTENSDTNHFGIGLNICKFLTEKHGGSLTISNSINGGAIVCADFFVM